MDIPVKSKPPGYGHADRLPQLAQPDFEAGLQTARNPSEPPDPAPDVCHARLQFRRRSQGIKDIQAQMRHASVNTTANVYTKPIPQSVRNAVEALDRRIRKREKRPKTRPKVARKRC